MTTDTDDPRVGADWELGEAARKFREAWGANDPAVFASAMGDLIAAIGSKSSVMTASFVRPVMEQQARFVDEMNQRDAEQRAQTRIQSQRHDYILGEVSALVTKQDNSVDAFAREMTTLIGLVREVQTTVGKLEGGQAELVTRVSNLDERDAQQHEESQKDRARLSEGQARVEGRLARIEEILDPYMPYFTPEVRAQRERDLVIFEQMKAEWLAAHPEADDG
jgi:hypothetical protein